MDRWIEEWCIYNFATGSFHTKNFVADLFKRNWILLAKTAKSRFVPPFGGLRGNVHGSSMARWKARGRLPISANGTFFSLAITIEALPADIGRKCGVQKGVGSFCLAADESHHFLVLPPSNHKLFYDTIYYLYYSSMTGLSERRRADRRTDSRRVNSQDRRFCRCYFSRMHSVVVGLSFWL